MAPNTVASVIIGNERVFQSMMVEIISSSPNRFGVGGSPKLETQVIIHHKVRSGAISLNPREIDRVRVLFRSYSRLAKQNSAEDMSPWAIISARAPFTPHFVIENIPDATILIWPTEE